MTMMDLRRALCLVALLAASCRTPEPITTTVVQTVDRPVAVPCIQPQDVPRQPTRLSEDQPVPPPTLTEMVGRLRAKLEEWQRLYGPTANDLLVICSQLPEADGPVR